MIRLSRALMASPLRLHLEKFKNLLFEQTKKLVTIAKTLKISKKKKKKKKPAIRFGEKTKILLFHHIAAF